MTTHKSVKMPCRVSLHKFLETPWDKLMQSNYSVSEIMKTVTSYRF